MEETRALNFVNAYEHYGAYAAYRRYNDLGDLIEVEIEDASEEEALDLESRRADAHDLGLANENLFPTRFLNKDGGYDLQRELDEMWADASREKDLNPVAHFLEADLLRSKTNRLLGAVTILGIGLVCYTLVESVGKRLRYPMVGLGSLFSVIGVVFALIVEMGK